MIVTERLSDGRIHTYSDAGFKILQTDTGNVYDDAVDVVEHVYTETDQLIDDVEISAEEMLAELENVL